MSESTPARPKTLMRPTQTTKFHIDFNWWDRADRELDVYLRSHLCPEHQQAYADMEGDVMVDTVHPETAEVTRVLGIQHTLRTHCALQDDYLTPQTTLVNAVFRVFLANGNAPLSPEELGVKLARPAQMILRTLSSQRVYKGIRPFFED
jgi:hypothetical protein